MSFSYGRHSVFLFGLSSPLKKGRSKRELCHVLFVLLLIHILAKHILSKIVSMCLLGLCKIDNESRDFTWKREFHRKDTEIIS